MEAAYVRFAVPAPTFLAELEKYMEQALMAGKLIWNVLGGLGLFFMGLGALWFVDVYKKKN